MSLEKNIFKKYPNKYWVETGSYEGDGIQMAVEANYENIISIELADHLYKRCVERFRNKENVKLYKGDSELLLGSLIEKIDEPITFWLDGHYSACGTAIGNQETPLLFELKAIKEHKIKTHTIIIDDLRCWTKHRIGFDEQDLRKMLLEINKDYQFNYEDGYCANDVLVAKIS